MTGNIIFVYGLMIIDINSQILIFFYFVVISNPKYFVPLDCQIREAICPFCGSDYGITHRILGQVIHQTL